MIQLTGSVWRARELAGFKAGAAPASTLSKTVTGLIASQS